ncbi:MAG: diphthine--ammonia ligase [Candidatus Hadarchaeota archaeon]
MRLAALCSGGKDSALALWRAMGQGHEISCLVAMVSRREDSWMYHTPNIRLVDLFAECARFPLLKVETSGEKDEELLDLEGALSELNVNGVVSGAIASTYQKRNIDRICSRLGIKSLAPLWGKEPAILLREMLRERFEIIITAAAAEGLGPEWLGRKLDKSAIEDLVEFGKKRGINPAGEGGEYESLVLDAPFFRSKIRILEAKKVWHGTSGCYLVRRADIVVKNENSAGLLSEIPRT